MGTSRIRRVWPKAAGSRAATALSAASPFTPIRSRPSMRCFTPSEADLAHARRVVAAFAAQPDAGTLGIDGKMYDMPHLTAAQRALASAGEGGIMSSSLANEFEPSDDHAAIREGVRAVVTRFGDDYWLARDDDGEFPFEFHRAMADAGWLGITMPEEYGGAGLGVTEAAIMMHEVASHGGGMAAASAVHINLFGPHPIVVKGTPEQKARWVPRLVAGEDQCCFGFTEPDAGLNTTRIKTFAQKVARRLPRSRPEGLDLDRAGRQQDHAADPHHQAMRIARGRPTASPSSTPISTAPRSRSAGSPRWAARRSIPMRSSSTACSSRMRTGSARRARASPTSCTASIRSASWSAAEAIGHRPGCAAPRHQICARARRVRPADRPEPGHPASAGGELDVSRSRPGRW